MMLLGGVIYSTLMVEEERDEKIEDHPSAYALYVKYL